MIAGGALTLAACEDDSSGYPPGNQDAGTPTQVLATIAANHGHALVVSRADLSAGEEKTYDITGSAGHAHSVTLRAADFDILREYGTLTVQSTTGSGHSHSVMVVY